MFDIFAAEDAPATAPQPAAHPLDALLAGLNPPQAEAVQTTEGPLLVLAGAGTGKTSVLTRRIAYLLLSHSAMPHQILAVTFTNKAAKEMAERTEKLVGGPVSGMWLGTFHRLGNRFLRQHAEAAGLRTDFVILDTDDQQRLIAELIKDLNLDSQQFPARLIANILSRYKDNAWMPADLPHDEARALGGRAKEVYQAYQNRLQNLNAVDFGDLLLLPLTILQGNAGLRENYQTRFRYILVDEYQDTNTVQYQWLKLLAEKHKNICVVGDDDQSIYAWRGAQVGNILNFEHDFPGAHTIRLEQNYRSTGHILAAANAVIANNRQRHGKNLWTDAGHGTPLELHPLLDDREEARFVADQSQRHLRERGFYNDIAVLVRTASQTRVLEEQFMRAGVPYTMVGGLRFYERREIKDAIAYLRLVANPRDDLAFQRIVNVPKRGVGDTTLATIAAAARTTGAGMAHAAADLIEKQELGPKIATQLNVFLQAVENWRTLPLAPHDLMERILEESGYAEMLRQDKSKDDGQDAKARLDNLKELIRALGDYADIQSFLDHVALVADADNIDDADTVKLMTIHAAKGLEYPLVFLPGFEEGLFPHQRSLNDEGQKGLEEERRLAYVALTRAKQRCVISYAHARRMWGQYLPGAPSRFLTEIPEQHLQRFGSTAAYSSYGTTTYGTSPSMRHSRESGNPASLEQRVRHPSSYKPVHGFIARSPQPAPSARTTSQRPHEAVIPAQAGTHVTEQRSVPSSNTPPNTYTVGTRVHHAKFGPGEITSIDGKGEAQTLTIAFKHAGTKKLLTALAKLQPA
ncbi:MAG: UvrD-helicase domain-containing protein [Pseudomonadaceae bacterium]|nr:UvrD-helicase domain-containing protein [Pseudomonadaceae bacterium]